MEEVIEKIKKLYYDDIDEFTNAECLYFYNHLDYFSYFNEKRIEIKYIEDGIFQTDLGTFLVKNIKEKAISENDYKNRKKVSVLELYNLLDFSKLYNYGHGYIRNFVAFLKIEIDLKNKNLDEILKFIRQNNFLYLLACLPVEIFNNEGFNTNFKFLTLDNLNGFKFLMDKGYDFSKNKKLMFTLITHFDINKKFIEDNYVLFLEFLFKYRINGSGINKQEYISYLLKHFDVDDELLLILYKNDPLLSEYFDEFKKISKTIENKSPKVILDESNKEVHIRYNLYDLYDGVAVKSRLISNEPFDSDFEKFFLHNNAIIVKLYNKYYKQYVKQNTNGTIKNFIFQVLLNFNNFINVINDVNFSIKDIESLSSLKYCFDSENIRKFDNNYRNYINKMKNYYLKIYNNIVINKDNFKKLGEILKKIGINEDNFYKKILNNKFLDSKMKTTIINIIQNYYGISPKVIDIIDILDEMEERKLNLDEILREKKIEKNLFMKMYEESLEYNPILHDYIKSSLSNNKRIGYKKLIRLGYKVLNSNLKSLEDYNLEFDYDIDDLINSLKNTELSDKLLDLKNSWS